MGSPVSRTLAVARISRSQTETWNLAPRSSVVGIGWSTLSILFAGVIAGSPIIFDLGGSVTLVVLHPHLALGVKRMTEPVIVATDDPTRRATARRKEIRRSRQLGGRIAGGGPR